MELCLCNALYFTENIIRWGVEGGERVQLRKREFVELMCGIRS